jgi:hypothetical protein
MCKVLFIVFGICLFVSNNLLAQKVKPTPTKSKTNQDKTITNNKTQTAITDDGKKVILKSDNTWEYDSNDSLESIKQNQLSNKTVELKLSEDTYIMSEVLQNCSSNNIRKDQFETYSQFLERIENGLEKLKTKSGLSCKDFYISISLKDYPNNTEEYYNPNTEIFTVPNRIINTNLDFRFYNNNQLIDKNLLNYYGYVYGLTNTIDADQSSNLVMASNYDYSYPKNFDSPTQNFNKNVSFKISQNTARENFPNLRLVIFAFPIGYFKVSPIQIKETIKSEIKTDKSDFIVLAKKKFYIMNELTGQVFYSGDYPVKK